MFLQLKYTDIGYKTPLIKGVQTSLDLGDVCLLIGDNGTGKTTLIKSILNQISSLEGEILLNQKDIKTLSAKAIAKQIAVVFSKSQIPDNYTVTDLISLGKYIHYPYYFELNKKDLQKVENIIESLNLSQYKNLTLDKLSDGNLQKAFIGRAIAQNSPMIILDEPTTHLDESNKYMILSLLRDLAKMHNKLILFSSHDWRLAKDFSDKIWFVYHQELHSGMAEDILIKHDEVLNLKSKIGKEKFALPTIISPDLEGELLRSFLMKNSEKNLSEFQFELKDSVWSVSATDFQQNFYSFEEMLGLIKNLH